MPYQHCPNCRLTVYLDGEVVRDGPCPRCGATLMDEPRPLFADAASRELGTNAVRLLMRRTGGRFSRRRAEPGRLHRRSRS